MVITPNREPLAVTTTEPPGWTVNAAPAGSPTRSLTLFAAAADASITSSFTPDAVAVSRTPTPGSTSG